MKFNKVQIICPGNVVTGGPEALHHLAHVLNNHGIKAEIVYTPHNNNFQTPKPYDTFNVVIGKLEDTDGNLIIYPEVYPMEALKIKNAKAAIWWLSVDNFLERRHSSFLGDKLRYLKRVLRGQRPLLGIRALKKLIHFSQSYYSSTHLSSCSIESIDIYEPINDIFLTTNFDSNVDNRCNEILYNPNKGQLITKELILQYPDWQFTPLKGFTRDELSNKLSSSKIYIDFGHHPGRDRLPREAAMHGCCVITGLLGSAGNPIDIPIPDKYKLDSTSPDFIFKFGELATDIFHNFSTHYENFDKYRHRIRCEPKLFEQQVKTYFLN